MKKIIKKIESFTPFAALIVFVLALGVVAFDTPQNVKYRYIMVGYSAVDSEQGLVSSNCYLTITDFNNDSVRATISRTYSRHYKRQISRIVILGIHEFRSATEMENFYK